jgi:hypothetical protein
MGLLSLNIFKKSASSLIEMVTVEKIHFYFATLIPPIARYKIKNRHFRLQAEEETKNE